MQENLKKLTVKSILWNALDKGGSQFIFFVSGIILARILSPVDYGLVGMIAIFIALGSILLDGGFANGLIRKEVCTERDYNTVFYFNLIISVVLYTILYFAAPFIASFFNQPKLILISRIIFLVLIFNSFGIIQNAILLKLIKNKAITITNISSLLISSSIALLLAFLGYAVWALVIQIVVQSIARTILLWMFSNWRPKLIFSMESLKDLFPFSSKLLLSKIIGTSFQNAYSFLIGKFYTPKTVGYYSQGSKWSDMGIVFIYNTVQSAIFPVFATIQNDEERLIRAYRKTIRVTAFFTFPAIFGGILVGESLINTLLSSKWQNSVIIFKWLCLGGLFTTFTAINMVFSQIKGRSDILLKIETSKIILITISLFFTIKSGIVAITIGQVVVNLLIFIMSLSLTGKEVGYSIFTQIKDMLPYFGLSVIMALTLYPIRYISENYIFLLSTQIIFGACFYFGANKLLNSMILNEIITIIKTRKI